MSDGIKDTTIGDFLTRDFYKGIYYLFIGFINVARGITAWGRTTLDGS